MCGVCVKAPTPAVSGHGTSMWAGLPVGGSKSQSNFIYTVGGKQGLPPEVFYLSHILWCLIGVCVFPLKGSPVADHLHQKSPLSLIWESCGIGIRKIGLKYGLSFEEKEVSSGNSFAPDIRQIFTCAFHIYPSIFWLPWITGGV